MTVLSVLLLMARDPDRWHHWLAALAAAWLAGGVILLAAVSAARIPGHRTLTAVERLMGMLLTTVAVQMFLSGVQEFMALPG